ncbi:MAG: TonB-dependent receptor, partial [Bacteroidota bacterium]
MKYLVLMASIFCSLHWTYAQEEDLRVSIEFSDISRKEALLQIEEITTYQVFFVDEWLSDELISGSFSNVSLKDVLEHILDNTSLNFYLLQQKYIVLTRNIIIRDQLPQSFTRDSILSIVQDSAEISAVSTIYAPEEKQAGVSRIETIRIGKESRIPRRGRLTLKGFVRNAVSGEPISNLALIVKETQQGTSTNADGAYEIQLPSGTHVLQTQAIGYESVEKRVILYNNGSLDFSLNESVERLDEVIVESNRTQNVEEVVTGIVELEIAEIKNIPLVLGERDILKTAITLPGIANAGEGAAGYNVRGGGTDQNLILLDDAVIYNPAHFFGIFSALNPFTTGKVTIYKGSIPAEYGGRLSSVFDINTKNANTKKFSGEASIGPVTSNLTLETPIVKGRSGLMVGGRSTYSNWILRSLDEESLRNSTASFFDVIAKYNDSINENNNITATGYFSRDAFSITSDSIYSYSNRLFSVKWNHKFNEQNSMNVLLSNSAYGFNIEFEGDADKNFDLGYKVNETELKFRFLKLFRKSHSIAYGLSSKLYVVNPGDVDPIGSASIVEPLSIPRERGLESAVFISDNFTVSKKLSLDLGLRYSFYAALGEGSQRIYQEGVPRNEGTLVEVQEFDSNEVIKTYGGPEARLSARYFLTPDFSVKASYNNAFQYIHTISSNTTISPTDTWKLSDTNIEPQRAQQFSAGLYKNFDDNKYELSIEGYYKRSRNLLDYKVGAQLLLNEELETEVLQGDGKAYGVEFLIKKRDGRLNGWLGYTYS